MLVAAVRLGLAAPYNNMWVAAAHNIVGSSSSDSIVSSSNTVSNEQ